MEKNRKCIKFKNVVKRFKDFTAVDGLNLTLYTDQLFVLLGHNGAGKTTTISMLAGMIEKTSGFLEVLGDTSMEEIRKKIGICPQHDILYDDLTVEDHLRLFGAFRGLSGDALD